MEAPSHQKMNAQTNSNLNIPRDSVISSQKRHSVLGDDRSRKSDLQMLHDRLSMNRALSKDMVNSQSKKKIVFVKRKRPNLEK